MIDAVGDGIDRKVSVDVIAPTVALRIVQTAFERAFVIAMELRPLVKRVDDDPPVQIDHVH